MLKGLAKLPDETVIDGEIVALDEDGRPSFNALQNYGSAATPIVYYVFDVMVLAGRDVMRRAARGAARAARAQGRCRSSPSRSATSATLDAEPARPRSQSVKAQGFEGLVAKRRDSRYEPGLRSGAWQKMRVNRGQEFVIGGYTVGDEDVRRADLRLLRGRPADLRRADAQRLHARRCARSCSRSSAGWRSPSARSRICRRRRAAAGGQGLTKAKMADCRWLKPVLVGQFEFLEWTGDNHLRHSKFIGLREDKDARDVRRE